MDKEIKKFRLSPTLIIFLLLVAFFCISLLMRVLIPWDKIFVGESIKFSSNDAYYYMRLVDNIVHNFPSLTPFDPFFSYPDGLMNVGSHFFPWIIAAFIWIIGLGSPSQHLINVCGVLLPAILGALVVIPVFFIGKALFNRWVGVLAAGLIAVLPGEFLGRSILGFTDQHVAETLLTAILILFMILAAKTARERGMNLGHILKLDRHVIIKPLVYSLLGGIFLGFYLLTWNGGLLFIFIISLFLVIQFIINQFRGKPVVHLGIVCFIQFLVAMIMYLPFSASRFQSVAIFLSPFVPLVLIALSLYFSSRNIKPVFYPVSLVVSAVLVLVAVYLYNAIIFHQIFSSFNIFAPSGSSATTTLEMRPFLSPQGSFSTAVAWGNFTTSFFLLPGVPIPGLALLTLAFMIFLYIKRRGDNELLLLLLVWTLVILVATLSQRRFAYYLSVNIALLSAYLSWKVIWLAGLRHVTSGKEDQPGTQEAMPRLEKGVAATKQRAKPSITIYHINSILAILTVFVIVFLFNIVKSKDVAASVLYVPSDGWESTMYWLKDNTPEPFGDPNAYYGKYERPLVYGEFQYPDSAYSIVSWWDYGYWISRTAHRIPVANPSQSSIPIKEVAALFLSTDDSFNEDELKILREIKPGYFIIDYDTMNIKFWAVINWSDHPIDEYVGVYYFEDQGQIVPLEFFYPAFYKTLCARLYYFDGKAVEGKDAVVLTYTKKTDNKGNVYRIIDDFQIFDTYDEAVTYTGTLTTPNYTIVGYDQTVSPISLKALEDFTFVYSSTYGVPFSENVTIPEVKVFQYLK